MKKIYLSILTGALAFTVNAQLTLTKAFNEPVIGDIEIRKGYDSTTTVPKNSGAGQSWNFSSLTSNTVTEVHTYTTVASTPSASSFPSATLADDDGTGNYNYFKSTPSTYEMVGFVTAAGSSATFTDSGIIASWPVSFGYSSTDTYAGTVDYLSITGPGSGTVNVTAPGSGTVTLPGSIVFNNCLQVKIENLSYANIGTFPLTFTINGVTTEYHYYTGTQKFPIVMVAYDSQTVNSGSGPTVQNSASITINNNVLTGINNINLEALNYNVYPNPTTNNVNINLTNEKTEAVSVVVINNLGQIVRSIDLGSAPEIKYLMNTSDLTSGIYHVKTTVGEKSTTKKLIIQ
jgi:hypothetical protein